MPALEQKKKDEHNLSDIFFVKHGGSEGNDTNSLRPRERNPVLESTLLMKPPRVIRSRERDPILVGDAAHKTNRAAGAVKPAAPWDTHDGYNIEYVVAPPEVAKAGSPFARSHRVIGSKDDQLQLASPVVHFPIPTFLEKPSPFVQSPARKEVMLTGPNK